eukprot:m.213515 g.213515  ORF g.213515 m.213515 type:complete len:617 (+) comp17177_c0_seq2:35-1885(+)
MAAMKAFICLCLLATAAGVRLAALHQDRELLQRLTAEFQSHTANVTFAPILYNTSTQLLDAFNTQSFDIGLLRPLEALCATSQSSSTVLANSVYTSTTMALTMDSAELLISPRSAVTSIQNLERAKIGVLQTDSLARFHAQRAALLKASNIDIVESEAQIQLYSRLDVALASLSVGGIDLLFVDTYTLEEQTSLAQRHTLRSVLSASFLKDIAIEDVQPVHTLVASFHLPEEDMLEVADAAFQSVVTQSIWNVTFEPVIKGQVVPFQNSLKWNKDDFCSIAQESTQQLFPYCRDGSMPSRANSCAQSCPPIATSCTCAACRPILPFQVLLGGAVHKEETSYYETFRPPITCTNGEVCAVVPAGAEIDIFLVDEAARLNATAPITSKLGYNETVVLDGFEPLDYAHYHFRYATKAIGLQVIQFQKLDGSLFTLIIESNDFACSQKIVAADVCRCSADEYLVDGICLSYSRVAGMCIVPLVCLAIAGYLFTTNGYKIENTLWKIKPTQLLFNKPPELLGRGSQGVVVKGSLRNTTVAVKQMIPHIDRGESTQVWARRVSTAKHSLVENRSRLPSIQESTYTSSKDSITQQHRGAGLIRLLLVWCLSLASYRVARSMAK